MAKIHKGAICHFGSTEKVYRSVIESIRQWPAKERTKTFVPPVQGALCASYMSHKQHRQVNCTAKCHKMYRHAHIYPTELVQGALVAS